MVLLRRRTTLPSVDSCTCFRLPGAPFSPMESGFGQLPQRLPPSSCVALYKIILRSVC